MTGSARWRLGVMMLLQYAIWGAWAPVLGAYFASPPNQGGLGFDTGQLGVIFSLLPLANIVAPFIAAQFADRKFQTQNVLAVLHLLGGVGLFIMASQTSYHGVLTWMLIFSLLYAPTLALTNSISFHNLDNSEKEFGRIRVWGSIGWILINWVLSLMRNSFAHLIPAGMSDSLILAGIMAIALGLFSFALPKTPPRKEGNPLAFIEAFGLLKDRNFAVFTVISFIVATELQFYYVLTSDFLQNGLHFSGKDVPFLMTTAQIAEIGVLAVLLPIVLPKWGVRKVMVLGILAWPIRYVIFAAGASIPALKWLVIASLTLHGFCYVFFFVVGFIYADQVAPKDIKASAQGLMSLVVLGVGSYLGSLFSGKIGDMFTNPTTHVINWTGVFLVPCALTILCAIVFPLLFKEQPALEPAAEAAIA
jgi:nucleoside transporter